MRSRHLTSSFLVNSYLFSVISSSFFTLLWLNQFRALLDGDDDPSQKRIEKINAFGEFLTGIRSSDKKFIVKFFPEKKKEYSDISHLSEALVEAVTHHDDKLRSAARGGAKMALGLMMSHFPDAECWRLGTGVPRSLPSEKVAELFDSVKGYATKIANMVSLTTYYPAEEIPKTLEDVGGVDGEEDEEDYEDTEN